MAERSHWWTDRWLRSLLFLSLSFSFSDYLPTYLSIYLPIYLSIYLSMRLYIYLSIYPSIHLFIDLLIYLPIYLSICLSVYLSTCLSIYLSIYLSLSLSLCLSVRLSVCPSVYLSIYLYLSLSLCLSVCLSARLKTKLFCETASISKLGNVTNAAIQRDFLNFCTWQHQQRSNSARLPSKMESWVQSWRPRANAFCDFCLNYCACHETVMPGHMKCCTCHAKSSQQTWRSEAPKCNPS